MKRTLKCALALFLVTSGVMFRNYPAQAQSAACGTITVVGVGDAPGGAVGTTAASAATRAEDVAKFNACERAKDNANEKKATASCPVGCMLDRWQDLPKDCNFPNPGPNNEPNPKHTGSGSRMSDPEWRTACERGLRQLYAQANTKKTDREIALECNRSREIFWDTTAAHAEVTATGTCVENPYGQSSTSGGYSGTNSYGTQSYGFGQ